MSYPDAVGIVLSPNEKRTVGIPVPKAPEPQAYDIAISLKDTSDGKIVSNRIVTHYVLRGASATIQNVTLDRDSYVKGDTVKAVLFWTPSADSFPDSRAGTGTELPKVSVRLEVADVKGRACITPLAKVVSIDGPITSLETQTISDCEQPTATVALLDGNGKMLDSRMIGTVQSTPESPSPTAEQEARSPGLTFAKAGLIVLVAVLFLASFGIIAWKTRGRWPGVWVIFSFAVLSGALSIPGRAEAGAFLIKDGIWTMATGTFDIQKPSSYVYTYQEKINISGSITTPECANAYKNWSVGAQGSGAETTEGCDNSRLPCSPGYPTYDGGYLPSSVNFGGSYAADGSAYNVTKTFSGSLKMPTKAFVDRMRQNGGYYDGTSLYVDIIVGSYRAYLNPWLKITPAVINGTCGQAANVGRSAAPSASLCNTGSASVVTTNPTTYSWFCNGSGTGATNASCSAPRIINGICGTTSGTTVASLAAISANLCSSGTVTSFAGTGPWTWTCDGSGAESTSATNCTASIAASLRLCKGGEFYAAGGTAGALVTLPQGETRNLTAFYDAGVGCSGTPVTLAATFTPSSPVITISANDPRLLYGADVPGSSASGQQSISASLAVTHAGQTVTMPVTVVENCSSGCAADAANHCQGESYPATNSCTQPETCPSGTRSCEYNWKEVAPGL
jgi:hypothetical protein